MCAGHPGAGGPATSAAADRVAYTVPPTASATTAHTTASSSRLCLARRFASAISGSSENGSRGTCTAMTLLSLAPDLTSSAAPRGHSGTLAQARALSPDGQPEPGADSPNYPPSCP